MKDGSAELLIPLTVGLGEKKEEFPSLTWLCHGLVKKKGIRAFTWEAALLATTVHLMLVCINKLPALL